MPSDHPRRSARPGSSRTRRGAWLVAGLLAAGLAAQEPRPAFRIEPEGTKLKISIDENQGLPLVEFIKLAQSLTGKVFTYSDQEMQQGVPESNIRFLGTKTVERDNFFAFFQTMLYIKGFATLLRGDGDTEIVEIVNMTGQKRTDVESAARYVPSDEVHRYANQTGTTILTSVELTWVNAQQAQNTLRPFFVGAGATGTNQLAFATVGNARALLVRGFGPQVYAAQQILKLLDVEPETTDEQFRVVRLEYQSAEELELILTEILNARARRAAQQPAGVTGGEIVQPQRGEMKILAHSTLNALLLSGSADQVMEAQDLIAKLDTPVELADGSANVVRLKNVLAEDLRQTLQQFIDADQQAEQQAQAQQGGTQTRRPRRTVVVAHRDSNSLLISGSRTKFEEMLSMIDELDRRQAQVLIECAVVELSTEDLTRLGVELGFLDIKENGSFTRPFGFTSFGISTFQDTDDNGLPDTRLPDFENPLQGVTGGIISSDDFAIPVLVNAIRNDSRANILSIPSVVVNDNITATVKTAENRPTQTVSQGNATTQSGAGADVGAGITLSISPSISTNNYLRLNVTLNVSRFLTPFDPNSVTAGVRAEREVQTAVTLPSGHTMILGGVIEDQESSDSSGIPILKDIPILGYLFRSSTDNRRKTNLYFFLTPHILNEEDFSDLAELSFRKKLEASSYIGNNRLQIVDRKWRDGRPETLEDSGATIDDIDARGGFQIPFYERPDRETSTLRGPATPETKTDPQKKQ
jgi:general secretion pathway protein D